MIGVTRMENLSFEELNLNESISMAISDMGFQNPTEVQYRTIPAIREGGDVIGRSQTGTGKTVAFGIPALEVVNISQKNIQVLILCPTRELAVQACDELKKLSKYMKGIKVVDVYGGAAMDRQIVRLKSANIVVGTPGRVMDHMRRKTLKLDNLKMIILDEADEMLSMGFREDIETILSETPEQRQTILFSATMPQEILALTEQYQKEPKLIEINRKQVTVDNIKQCFYDVPMGRKTDALNIILKYYKPSLAMIFCNTKAMVDEVTDYLFKAGFDVEGLHGDMKQSQRTKVMNGFKSGKTSVLVATDVAARGIDVSGIDYVINYDIPQNTEYYVHRIGRTGRAGKSGTAITICSGRRQVEVMKKLGRLVKSNIEQQFIPTKEELAKRKRELQVAEIENALANITEFNYSEMLNMLTSRGYTAELIAEAALQLYFGNDTFDFEEIEQKRYEDKGTDADKYQKLVINIGRVKRVAPNHIVGAITEQTDLSGREIGKIEIFDNETIVAVPKNSVELILQQMKNCKICGVPTSTNIFKDSKNKRKLYDDIGGGRQNKFGRERREHSRGFDKKRDSKHDSKPKSKSSSNKSNRKALTSSNRKTKG